ncbi:hypothetical protein ACOI1H_17635 [Loktanella sp. DJP18]|uniref:hypothetical protein n=1 Tax=Loktanella sp. DJP18 TaxID=3409788 RepID=UPI003BB68DD8
MTDTLQTSPMTETDFASVQAAVHLARGRQIRNAKSLRSALMAQGFSDAEAGRALVFSGD